MNSDKKDELKREYCERIKTAELAISRLEKVGNSETLKKAAAFVLDLKKALARIDQKDFGQCEICHGDISWDRLLIYPEERRCASCSSKPAT